MALFGLPLDIGDASSAKRIRQRERITKEHRGYIIGLR